MTLSCLIPAWNEEARIGGVLDAVAGHPLISRVLVIDDGSGDATGDVARARGAEVLRTDGNLGKTRALVQGLRRVGGGQVLLLDADLVGLRPPDLSALARPVLSGQAGASISLRGNAPGLWRAIGLDYISGERVLPHALLAPHLDRIEGLPRFGFEVFVNRLLLDAGDPVAVVRWPGVASPSKASKRGSLMAGLGADARMLADIGRTVGWAEAARQIAGLRRLRAPAGRS
ncbi:MAG: glycosyltransferase family 2 protein [Rubellimicrobium sp.]|nr:glycosyltransferase family 2 protein [Rubellimicrobium sp.]